MVPNVETLGIRYGEPCQALRAVWSDVLRRGVRGDIHGFVCSSERSTKWSERQYLRASGEAPWFALLLAYHRPLLLFSVLALPALWIAGRSFRKMTPAS